MGTAMGTIFAPTYATIVLGYLEMKLYTIMEWKYDIIMRKYIEDNWDRYLDDCIILLDENKISSLELLNILNNLNRSIKFTMESSEQQLPFLDIMLNINERKVWMDLYSKPTDSKRYVPFDSCHPKPFLTNIPYCLARRICMIVECFQEKENKLKELKLILEKQGYPKRIINNGIQKAERQPQENLRKEKNKTDENLLTFITTYNPNNPNLFPIIKQSVEQLKSSETLRDKLNKKTLICCRKQPPNLEHLLCKTTYINNEKVKVSKCGKNCVCCPYIKEGTEFKFKYRDIPFKVISPFNCNTSNLLYVITCPECNEEYIGQTGRTLRERVVLYRQHIRTKEYQMSLVEEHLRTCGNSKFQIFPFFKLRSMDKINRETYESTYIKQLKPALNRKN